MPYCVLHRLICKNGGLPGGIVASFYRFLGVPLFGDEPGGCPYFRRSPFFIVTLDELVECSTALKQKRT